MMSKNIANSFKYQFKITKDKNTEHSDWNKLSIGNIFIYNSPAIPVVKILDSEKKYQDV